APSRVAKRSSSPATASRWRRSPPRLRSGAKSGGVPCGAASNSCPAGTHQSTRISSWRVNKGDLLDTNVALIGADTPERFSRPIRQAVERGPAFLSTISYWEVVIKSMKGTLQVGDPRQWWSRTLQDFALRPLPQSAEHISAICDLPA